MYKLAGTVSKLGHTLVQTFSKLARTYDRDGCIYNIVPAALPKFKLYFVGLVGVCKVELCCITMTGTSYWINAQLPGPWFTWLRHSAIIVFTLYRVPTSLRDLNQTLFLLWQIVQLHSRYTIAAPHISMCNSQIGHLPHILPIGGLCADIVRNRSEPVWTILTLLLMNSSEPFGTVLNYWRQEMD